ncbi:glutaredoxin family protein [Aquimarina sp. U1-2]|uniref:glutaredoxin family protein n=1 Tax=Aquimarina sp. U1-2 TaxID=2823141 RepID=UPI001AEC9A02|nr:glutaredoxin family protein [Aquimarina sp. U1-2]MBP2831952.1 glutaredoxin family protein [Aquimarina sp. U1-2]
MANHRLKLYGTNWCPKSAIIRNYLQSIWIEFDDYNVETNPDAEAQVRSLYDGTLKFPTITYGDDFLKNPSRKEIDAFLKKHHL